MSSDGDPRIGGFGRIARGLSDLLDLLSELDETSRPRRGRREKNGVVVEYSFGRRSIVDATGEDDGTMQAAAAASAPHRAARRRRAAPPETIEPATDLFDEPDEIVLLFELPGVTRQQIRCRVDGDIVRLDAESPERAYHKEILIEALLAESAPRLRLRNGILEVRLAKRSS